MNTIQTFEVGKRYYMRSACNYEVMWFFTVISRTKKFITLQDDKGRVRRRGVYVLNNEERANPLAAGNIVNDEFISDDNAKDEVIEEECNTCLIIPIR